MPPKSSTISSKAASIPNRPSNTPKNSNGAIPVGNGNSGKPNKSIFDQEQDQYKREIEKLQARVSELRFKIEDTKSGDGYAALVARRQALRAEMDQLRESQTDGKKTRGKIIDQIRDANDSLQRKIKELNASRGKLNYKTPVEVDVKIKQLESQIESGTMRIVEEKKAIAEIQNLRKIKKLVESFGPIQDSIEFEKLKVEELRKKMDDPASKSINDRWSEIKAELDKINAKMAESNKSRDKLFEERNQIQDELTQVYEKKRESFLRHKEANEKYQAKIQEDQQRRINRQKAERDAEAKAEIERATLEMREQAAIPAYEREIEDCRTLILYFDKLMGNKTSSSIENSANGAKDSKPSSTLPQLTNLRQTEANEDFETMVVVKKKTNEEEFFMGGGKKNNKKNKKPSTNEVAVTNQPLNLPLATINALFALAVAVPMTREDVANTIATLSEKKNWFTENQERMTQERIAETERKIASAQAQLKSTVPDDTNNPTEPEPSSVEFQAERSNNQLEVESS